MSDFSEFLYTLRKEKNMTQAELAERLGITNKAVSKWETGDAMPETSLLLPLAEILGVTADELLSGRRAPRAASADGIFHDGHLWRGTETPDFFRDKDKSENTLYDKICGVLCGCLVAAGATAFLIVGFVTGLWHPYWTLLVASALGCGIVAIIFDWCNRPKCRRKIESGENPYTGGVCGIVMLSCVIIFLFLGAFLNLWHPAWVILAAGGVVCIALGSIGALFL